jgi:tetratricopeptide (TPR) repeat protein
MRLLRLFLSIVTLLVIAGPVLVSRAAADDVDTCKQVVGDEAIAACTRVIGSGGDLAWAYVKRGNAYSDKGDLDHAIADYNDAIRLDPKSGLAYVMRGNAYYDKGYFDHAIADDTEAIRLDPLPRVEPSVKTGGYGHLNIYVWRGDAYLAKGDLDRALADYEQAVRLDPEYPYAYNGRGNAYLRKGDDVARPNDLRRRDRCCR